MAHEAPSTKRSQEALEALILGNITPEEYRDALESGKISGPKEFIWRKIDKLNVMEPDDIRTAQGGRIEDRDISQFRFNADVVLPDQAILDTRLEANKQRKASEERAKVAAQEAEDAQSLAEFLDLDAGRPPEDVISEQLAGVEGGAVPGGEGEVPPLPIDEVTDLDVDGDGIPQGFEAIKLSYANGLVREGFRDILTGEVSFGRDVQTGRILADAELARVNQDIATGVAQVESMKSGAELDRLKFAVESTLGFAGLAQRKAEFEASTARADADRAAARTASELSALQAGGPFAVAVQQAIQARDQTVDLSGSVVTAGGAADFDVPQILRDLFGLDDVLGVQPSRRSALTSDLSLGNRLGTPEGEPIDVAPQNVIAGQAASTVGIPELQEQFLTGGVVEGLSESGNQILDTLLEATGLTRDDLSRKVEEKGIGRGPRVFSRAGRR